jgi:hypothetical protein
MVNKEDEMKQVYYPYTEWEDYKAGMWRKIKPENEKHFLNKAIKFTGDSELYGSWMLKVIEQWPKTCKHNLSDKEHNGRAFIGHAACCLAFNCPEYITREAWGYLTKKQQDDANEQAEIAIMKWNNKHCNDQPFLFGDINA